MMRLALFSRHGGVRRYDKIPRMRPPLIIALASMLLFGCALPALAVPTTRPEAGTVLFKDDFSSPISGWDHTKYPEGIMDYDSGGYRILVNAPQVNYWASPRKDFADVRVEVDTGKLGGPDENRIGLICRSSVAGDHFNFYFLMISSDGYYGLGLLKEGAVTLLDQEQMVASSSIHKGMAVNHLRLDCTGNSLSGYVNGFELAQVHDSTLTHGDVGVLAGAFAQPGVDIFFDNFVVFAP